MSNVHIEVMYVANPVSYRTTFSCTRARVKVLLIRCVVCTKATVYQNVISLFSSLFVCMCCTKETQTTENIENTMGKESCELKRFFGSFVLFRTVGSHVYMDERDETEIGYTRVCSKDANE
jgi:hypothetical protein